MARLLGTVEHQVHYRTTNFGTPRLQHVERWIHEQYSDQPLDLHAQVVARAGIQRDHAVGDIGCGTGRFLQYLAARSHRGRLVGLDISAGILPADPIPGATCVVADTMALPLRDGSLDVCCLQHMLGYVPDMASACSEAARVLRLGGTFVAIANSKLSYPHALDYRRRATHLFGWPPVAVNPHRFCLENMHQVLVSCQSVPPMNSWCSGILVAGSCLSM